MEADATPLLPALFDDHTHFRVADGELGAADAVSTFNALSEAFGYESKLLLGLWRNGGLAGAVDCIMGYHTPACWTVGMLVVADRHRGTGIGSSVLSWLERTAVQRGSGILRGAGRRDNAHGLAFAKHRGYTIEPVEHTGYCFAVKTL